MNFITNFGGGSMQLAAASTPITWVGNGASGSKTNWFNRLNWNPNTKIPDTTHDITIPNTTNKPIVSNAALALGNTLTVNTSAIVTLNLGASLRVVDTIANNGTITSQQPTSPTDVVANITQDNDVANTGTGKFELSVIKNLTFNDYVYWGTPTSGQQISNFSPNHNPKYTLTHDGKNSFISVTSNLIPGVGYEILAPLDTPVPPSRKDQLFTFRGTPNNGTITYTTKTVTNSDGYVILGNPYASALNVAQFLFENKALLAEDVIYRWTQLYPLANGTYSLKNYVTTNMFGSVRRNGQDYLPDYILPGGDITIASIAPGSVFKFKNNQRVMSSSFTATNRDRIWLNLKSAGSFNQVLFGYSTADVTWGHKQSHGSSFPTDDSYIAIKNSGSYNFMFAKPATAYSINDSFALAYNAKTAGTFTIELDRIEGNNVQYNSVWLYDNGVKVQDLTQGSYDFTTAVGTFDNRFTVKFL